MDSLHQILYTEQDQLVSITSYLYYQMHNTLSIYNLPEQSILLADAFLSSTRTTKKQINLSEVLLPMAV